MCSPTEQGGDHWCRARRARKRPPARYCAGQASPSGRTRAATRVLKVRGVRLAGQTPLATISAMFAVENKQDGLFERVAPGTYRLREEGS